MDLYGNVRARLNALGWRVYAFAFPHGVCPFSALQNQPGKIQARARFTCGALHAGRACWLIVCAVLFNSSSCHLFVPATTIAL